MSITLWILAAVAGAGLIFVTIAVRNARRRKTSIQQAPSVQLQRPASAEGATKRQIGQLQADIAIARRQRKESGNRDAKWSSTMQDLNRELDRAPLSRQLPPDGFADTQPWQQSQHAASS